LKVLVTGGAGFIGSQLVDTLLQEGHQVVVVDDLSTGSVENVNPQAKLHEMDVRDERLADVFEQERPDIVSHHAAQGSVTRSMEDPLFDASQNILGGLGLILLCLRFRVKKFIYASSGGAVYGEPQYLPVDEKHPVNPMSPYGVSKHVVEHYLRLYGDNEGLNYVILRYPNVYGPRQNPRGEAGVVAIFATQMLRGERPAIYGDGRKTRDYLHVSDVVAANLLAIESEVAGGVFNIGTGLETSDQEVFDAISKVTGYDGAPLYAPVRKGDIQRTRLDSSQARRQLRWKASISFREGIIPTVDYYRKLQTNASR
jgi:UDP-glucose 4-epimerase